MKISHKIIEDEVYKLLKSGDELNKDITGLLLTKYKKEVVENIVDEFNYKKNKINKIAKKFILKFQSKNQYGYSLHEALKLLDRYNNKHNLDEPTYNAIKIMFEKRLFNNGKVENKYVLNNISSSLG